MGVRSFDVMIFGEWSDRSTNLTPYTYVYILLHHIIKDVFSSSSIRARIAPRKSTRGRVREKVNPKGKSVPAPPIRRVEAEATSVALITAETLGATLFGSCRVIDWFVTLAPSIANLKRHLETLNDCNPLLCRRTVLILDVVLAFASSRRRRLYRQRCLVGHTVTARQNPRKCFMERMVYLLYI